MSLIKLTPDQRERFTLVTRPKRFYHSSSSGITGSVDLYARKSVTLKETEKFFSGDVDPFNDTVGVLSELKAAQEASLNATNIENSLSSYIDAVTNEAASSRYNKVAVVNRFVPGYDIEKTTLKKSAIINNLMPYYRGIYDKSEFIFTNYHSLNFFTSSDVPDDSVIIYPNPVVEGERAYTPQGDFTFDFYLNPRYTSPPGEEYTAGTILHVSSTFALSIVTGSFKSPKGKPEKFRLMLQLSHSADIAPSSVDLSIANNARTYPSDLIFLSDDDSLDFNTWHHIAVRWGTNNTNDGSGSFIIDRQTKGTFNVPSSSIATQENPALFLGNYYDAIPNSSTVNFFNNYAAVNEGVTQLTTGSSDPTAYSFNHPLNAEIHDIKIFRDYRSYDDIVTSSLQGPDNLDKLLFYVPCFFVRETRHRQVFITQFEKLSNRETFDPFNVDLAFQVAGHDMNLEGYVREFVQKEYPRLHKLTGTLHTTTGIHASEQMYESNTQRKRNLSVLPCDNGKFVPNFELLRSGTVTTNLAVSGTATEKFKRDTGGLDLQVITLRNLISEELLQSAVSGGLEEDVYGASPENPQLTVGSVPTVFQRTRDSNSNQITFFDIPNLFYGRRIVPGTFNLYDSNLSGSGGAIQITLKDDGRGNLYRADSSSSHAEWNSVGNLFYNEGIALIKSPSLFFIGKHQHTLQFDGERNIYVTKLNIPAPGNLLNSSSNPTFFNITASSNANENSDSFVYITNITLHDENLNVVGRTNLAQPVIKRLGDRFRFDIKLDW